MSGGLLFCAYSSCTAFLLFYFAFFFFLTFALLFNVQRQRYDTSPAEDRWNYGYHA